MQIQNLEVKPGQVWQHYKGNLYHVVGVAAYLPSPNFDISKYLVVDQYRATLEQNLEEVTVYDIIIPLPKRRSLFRYLLDTLLRRHQYVEYWATVAQRDDCTWLCEPYIFYTKVHLTAVPGKPPIWGRRSHNFLEILTDPSGDTFNRFNFYLPDIKAIIVAS